MDLFLGEKGNRCSSNPSCGHCLMWHPSVGRAAALKADRNALPSQVMSLPFVFLTDAGNTDSLPGGPTAPGSKYRLERAGPSSDASLAQDTVEVLLLRLKPDTQYKATVYPQAGVNGAEGQPQATEFKTSMWSFVKWLQPEFPIAKFVSCDSGPELSLAS